MGKRGKRTRVLEHVYQDKYGYEVSVKRAGRTHSTRLPLGTSLPDLRRAVADLLDSLTTAGTITAAGTFARDVDRYCHLAGHISDMSAQRAHLRSALPYLGHLARHQITRTRALELRAAWLEEGVAPKTINNRFSALRALWHMLDGDEALTPFDGLKPMKSHRTPPAPVSPEIIVAVEQQLALHERRGWIRDQRTRARFRVLATTGARPSELMRAEPADLDLGRALWRVRDGKGGFRPVGVPLTPEAIQAWRLFVQAKAWGVFNVSSFAQRLRKAGWPAGVRPYELRHSLGIALSEAGVDLADISLILGHTRVQTTRSHYVGPSFLRMVAAMGKIAGKVAWVPAAGASAGIALDGIPQQKRGVKGAGSKAGTQAKVARKGQ
jgi:integrase